MRVELQSKTSPCKDCPNRELGCHGKCEAYASYRKMLDDIRARRMHENLFGYRLLAGKTKIAF